MKLFGALLVTLMASSACVGSSQVLTGSSSGDFVMLGSLCFPPGADDQVTITTTTKTANQMILFFDDQSSSFGDINAGSSTKSCHERETLARKICKGDNCQLGYQVPTGMNTHYTIDISETFARRWYFVLSNCQKDGDSYKPKAADLPSFKISSDAAIDCAKLDTEESVAGYVVAIVFLSVIVLGLGYVAFYMYKRNDVPAPMSTDKVGYNTLWDSW